MEKQDSGHPMLLMSRKAVARTERTGIVSSLGSGVLVLYKVMLGVLVRITLIWQSFSAIPVMLYLHLCPSSKPKPCMLAINSLIINNSYTNSNY